MNPLPELNALLKQLRLSSMLDSLEVRNRQAIESKMSYMDLILLLTPTLIGPRFWIWLLVGLWKKKYVF